MSSRSLIRTTAILWRWMNFVSCCLSLLIQQVWLHPHPSQCGTYCSCVPTCSGSVHPWLSHGSACVRRLDFFSSFSILFPMFPNSHVAVCFPRRAASIQHGFLPKDPEGVRPKGPWGLRRNRKMPWISDLGHLPTGPGARVQDVLERLWQRWPWFCVPQPSWEHQFTANLSPQAPRPYHNYLHKDCPSARAISRGLSRTSASGTWSF